MVIDYATIVRLDFIKQENTSHIIDLLQKLQNETDTLVKTANIFSLAKKLHNHGDETHLTNLDVDPLVMFFSSLIY